MNKDEKSLAEVSIDQDQNGESMVFDASFKSQVDDFGETHFEISRSMDATSTFDKSETLKGQPTEGPAPTYGKYQVDRVLGKGAFGAVYLAEDSQLNRQVAVKVPVLEASSPSEAKKIRKEFLEEARNLARLTHAGIVTVLDVATEGDECYIVSEFLDGPDLKQWLLEHSISFEQSAEIIAQIADALSYAHSQSTVHRDLKPGNVILTQRAEGLRPVIVDFGLAITDSPRMHAARGVVAGTPNYMSPEQARGDGHRIDGRTDIFALGVILYRMITGELPFKGGSVNEVLRRVVSADPVPPRRHDRNIPEALESICLKAMAKEVAERYTTAGDMASELREFLKKYQSKDQAENKEERTSASRSLAMQRQVTVLNCECDLFDSDEFLEQFTAEEQHSLFREYKQVCKKCVDEFGGTLVQSTGQSLLVCFGYPTAYEDAAQRAVRTGLALFDELANMRDGIKEKGRLELSVSIGVHTGAAVLQDGNPDEGETLSMMGEARTVAIRMGAVSPENALVVTESTERLVHGYFDLESQGKSRIKGAPEQIETFVVKSEREVKTRIDVSEPEKMTPLVGRDEEMALLGELWEQAEDSMGQIVCVIGEAGLGKSRLIREVRELVERESGDEPTLIMEWRCSPFFQNTALHPATEYLDSVLRLQSEPDVAKRLDLLVDHLKQHDLADPESVWLIASLLSVPTDDRFPPVPLSPQRQKEKTLDVLIHLLRQYSAKNNVLFVVEDLHWIDATTLELLGLLVDQALEDRILSLFTFRPEFETPWGSRAHQTQIALNRLTRAEVARMICIRVGLEDVSDDVVDKIIERTEGVPLFVEEFCNALVEANAFVTEDGKTRLADEFDIAAIPATLKDLLISRLDRLDIRSDLVLLGATIGREFSFKMIKAITQIDAVELANELDRLVNAEIVFREGAPPEAIYTFKHALIQDAAYDSLLTANRLENHLNIANVLETEFPETKETTPEVLAYHFTKAGQKEQGIQYWMQAGQLAQGKSANNEAISHFEAGLDLVLQLEEDAKRAELEMSFRFSLIAVLMGARGYAAPEIEPHHIRVQEIGGQSGDPLTIGRLLLPYWQWVFINGNYKKSIETTDKLLDKAMESNDAGLLTEGHWCSGCTKFFLGRFAEAVEHEEKALETYDMPTAIEYAKVSYQNSGPLAYAFLSKALWAMGKVDRAFETMDKALEMAPQLPEPFSMVVVNWNSADLGELMRDPERTIKYAEPTIKTCEELGFPFFLGQGICSSGNAMFMRGEYEPAAEAIQKGIDIMMSTGADIVFPVYFTFLAETNWKLGRRDEAREALANAFKRLEPGERFYEAEMLRVRGEFALDEGDPVAARKAFDESLAVAERQQAHSFRLRTILDIANQLAKEGNKSEARDMVLASANLIEGGQSTRDLIRAAEFIEANK